MIGEFTPLFVELIPTNIVRATLYISIKYQTSVHSCACGCGFKVVTPLDPAEWKLLFEGDVVSLYPSIGNWSATCESHYWIIRNKVVLAGKLTRNRILAGRQANQRLKAGATNAKMRPPLTRQTFKSILAAMGLGCDER
jgi:Family of unknown function (DUF6527)